MPARLTKPHRDQPLESEKSPIVEISPRERIERIKQKSTTTGSGHHHHPHLRKNHHPDPSADIARLLDPSYAGLTPGASSSSPPNKVWLDPEGRAHDPDYKVFDVGKPRSSYDGSVKYGFDSRRRSMYPGAGGDSGSEPDSSEEAERLYVLQQERARARGGLSEKRGELPRSVLYPRPRTKPSPTSSSHDVRHTYSPTTPRYQYSYPTIDSLPSRNIDVQVVRSASPTPMLPPTEKPPRSRRNKKSHPTKLPPPSQDVRSSAFVQDIEEADDRASSASLRVATPRIGEDSDVESPREEYVPSRYGKPKPINPRGDPTVEYTYVPFFLRML
jgi:hypothetical protein